MSTLELVEELSKTVNDIVLLHSQKSIFCKQSHTALKEISNLVTPGDYDKVVLNKLAQELADGINGATEEQVKLKDLYDKVERINSALRDALFRKDQFNE